MHYKDFKYALDGMFVFLLTINIVLFGLEYLVNIHQSIQASIDYLGIGVLAGYYFVFIRGYVQTTHKYKYIKTHKMMIVLLILPFFQMARILRIPFINKIFGLGTNIMWQVLDELRML